MRCRVCSPRPAKLFAAAAWGRSQTWTDSFWLAATVPAARRWLVNGTALPGIRATAGVGAALANPLAPTMDVQLIAATAALAAVAAMNVLVLDIAPLSVLWLNPVGRPGVAIPRPFIPSGKVHESGPCQTVTTFPGMAGFRPGGPPRRAYRSPMVWASSR